MRNQVIHRFDDVKYVLDMQRKIMLLIITMEQQ